MLKNLNFIALLYKIELFVGFLLIMGCFTFSVGLSLDIDSTRSQINDPNGNFDVLIAHLDTAERLLEENPVQAQAEAFKALDLAKSLERIDKQADALYYLAISYLYLQDTKPLIQTVNTLIELSQRYNLKPYEGDAYGILADYYYEIGDYSNSIIQETKAMQYYKTVGDTLWWQNSKTRMVDFLILDERFTEAEEEMRSILYLLERKSKIDQRIQSNIHYTMGNIFNERFKEISQDSVDLDSAIHYFKLSYNVDIKDDLSHDLTFTSLALADAFSLNDEIDSAWYYLQSAESLVSIQDKSYAYVTILEMRGRLYREIEEWDKAIKAYQEAIDLMLKLEYAESVQLDRLYESIRSCYVALGSFEEALFFEKKRYSVLTNVNSTQRLKNRENLLALYEIKEFSIDYEIQKAFDERKLWLTQILILFFVIVILVLSIIVYRIWQKNKELRFNTAAIKELKTNLESRVGEMLYDTTETTQALMNFISHHAIQVRTSLKELRSMALKLEPTADQKSIQTSIQDIFEASNTMDLLLREAENRLDQTKSKER